MKTIEASYDDVTGAYNALIDASGALAEVQLTLMLARRSLQDKQNEILMEYCDVRRHPKGLAELGSNKENRDAKLAQFTADHQITINRLEAQEMQARALVDKTRLLKDAFKSQWDHVKVACGAVNGVE